MSRKRDLTVIYSPRLKNYWHMIIPLWMIDVLRPWGRSCWHRLQW